MVQGKSTIRLDVRRFHLFPCNLRRISPERCGLGLEEVAHYHPIELGKRLALIACVLAAHCRVLAHDEKAFDLSIHHVHHHWQMGMVAGDFRMIIIAVVVLFRRCIAPLGLEVGHGNLRVIAPVAC